MVKVKVSENMWYLKYQHHVFEIYTLSSEREEKEQGEKKGIRWIIWKKI